MKPERKKYLLYASLIIVGGCLAYILIETIKAKNTGFETKTLWDWMELLVVPAVLAGGVILLNRSERALERRIADDRAKLEHDLATDRQREAALQTYFDRMSELLLKEKLRTTKRSDVLKIAKARTISILRTLDKDRRNSIMDFLRESELVVDSKSVLMGVQIENGIDLEGWDLSFVKALFIFIAANLRNSKMYKADLTGTVFISSDLSNAFMFNVNFVRGSIQDSNLQGAILNSGNFSNANLSTSDLSNSNCRDVNLQGAQLDGVNFTGANLINANLKNANLAGANLTNANLEGADLTGANMLGVLGITETQLKAAKSLKGVIMPDGTKHK